MLGDNQKQEQKQSVNQEVNVHGQTNTIEISCDYYTNKRIEALDKQLNDQLNLVGAPDSTEMLKLKELRKVNLLQYQGHVRKVFCSLLQDSTCKSSKNSGNRCYLLGPAPASASLSWKIQGDDE